MAKADFSQKNCIENGCELGERKMKEFDLLHIFSKSRISPTGLRIDNRTSTNDGVFSLNGPYMIVYESCFSSLQTLQISMLAPGYSVQYQCALKWFSKNRNLHKHDFMEFMFVVSGHILQKIETNTYEYSAGQCCLITPGINHAETFSEDAELFFFMVSNDFLKDVVRMDRRFAADGREEKNHHVLYNLFSNVIDQTTFQKQYLDFLPALPNDAVVPILEKYLAQIMAETIHHAPGFYPLILGNAERLISQLLNPLLYTWRMISREDQQEENLYLRIRGILEQCHGRITRQELADQLNYSEHHINNIIKRNTGMSLIKYSHIFTLKEAARRLTKTEDSISEIIFSLGFTNRTHFYSLFKAQYGVLPKEYRDKGIQIEDFE